MSVFVQPFGIVILFALLSIHTEAMLCQMGQEPDSNAARRYRWVIPVEDPCKCTKIRLGGINNRTPGRNFKVIYFDTFSNSALEIRKWLNCSGAFPGNRVKTTTSAVSGKVMGSIPASQSAVITTHATGNAPATSDIPVTSLSCVGRDHGGFFADPYNCTMYYQCSNGVAYHMQCALGTYFSVHDGIGSCTHTTEDTHCNKLSS